MIQPWKKMSIALKKAIEETAFGATCTGDQTQFNVFADQVNEIHLEIYNSPFDPPSEVIKMSGKSPIYSANLKGDYHGKYYRYSVKRDNQIFMTVDPWAKSMTANSALGCIIDHERCQPERFKGHSKPETIPRTSAILYETHLRDFTVGEQTNHLHKGKYLGAIERGRTSPDGQPTGLDHLVNLGITHIHLLPLHDMGSVDELAGGYNWGYDPMYFLAPEGSYATDPIQGINRVVEMKAMIQGFHEAGIGVVLDVVYNHTYEHLDHPFEILAPGWFFRKDASGNFGNGSGCGNETASESPIFQKYVLDSLEQYLKDYQIDGFRFDLLALHDQSFVAKIEETVKCINPSALLYGEPWTGGKSLLPKRLQFRQGSQKNMAFAVFNDHLRNGLKGDNDGLRKGFVSGGRIKELEVAKGIAGATHFNDLLLDYAEKPGEVINYASCHDNLCLYDKLKKVHPDASDEELARRSLLALSVVLLSFGTPFIQGGTEILRTKFGDHNSFISGDAINAYQWVQNEVTKAHLQALKAVIALRKALKVLKSDQAQEIQRNLYFLQLASGLIAYSLMSEGENYLIVHNAGKRTKTLKINPLENQTANFWDTNREGDWECLYDTNDYFGSFEDRGLIDLNALKIGALSTVVLRRA